MTSMENQMARVFRSLSGKTMELTDEDRILCIIMDTPWRTTTDIAGIKIVGQTAFDIRDALREEGFEIVRVTRAAD